MERMTTTNQQELERLLADGWLIETVTLVRPPARTDAHAGMAQMLIDDSKVTVVKGGKVNG